MKLSIWIVCFLLLLSQAVISQNGAEDTAAVFVFDCQTCHICEKPTKKEPCLRACPRAELITINHKPEEGPGMIIMDELSAISDIYEPVRFSHRVHSEMSGMAGGCTLCHHNNPPGHILACRDCHEKERARSDVSKPDLMGSYHRQCMDCHRAWSHAISCTSCHALQSDHTRAQVISDKPGLTGRVHPKIAAPGRVLYQTDCEDGKVVAFYHNDHVQLFGFECTDCHQSESCVRCHDQQKTIKSAELSHDRCKACHDTGDGCTHCHKEQTQDSFDHFRRTKFSLDGFHKNLACRSCHGSKLKRLNLSRECSSCHVSWSPGTFDHRLTGLILDENHIDIDCEECHAGRVFGNDPGCSACHEDFVYPEKIPGSKAQH